MYNAGRVRFLRSRRGRSLKLAIYDMMRRVASVEGIKNTISWEAKANLPEMLQVIIGSFRWEIEEMLCPYRKSLRLT